MAGMKEIPVGAPNCLNGKVCASGCETQMDVVACSSRKRELGGRGQERGRNAGGEERHS